MNPVAGSSRVEIDHTKPLRKLSVVLPVYNEKNTIRDIVERVLRSEISIEKELVIVDDFSRDGTREMPTTVLVGQAIIRKGGENLRLAAWFC